MDNPHHRDASCRAEEKFWRRKRAPAKSQSSSTSTHKFISYLSSTNISQENVNMAAALVEPENFSQTQGRSYVQLLAQEMMESPYPPPSTARDRQLPCVSFWEDNSCRWRKMNENHLMLSSVVVQRKMVGITGAIALEVLDQETRILEQVLKSMTTSSTSMKKVEFKFLSRHLQDQRTASRAEVAKELQDVEDEALRKAVLEMKRQRADLGTDLILSLTSLAIQEVDFLWTHLQSDGGGGWTLDLDPSLITQYHRRVWDDFQKTSEVSLPPRLEETVLYSIDRDGAQVTVRPSTTTGERVLTSAEVKRRHMLLVRRRCALACGLSGLMTTILVWWCLVTTTQGLPLTRSSLASTLALRQTSDSSVTVEVNLDKTGLTGLQITERRRRHWVLQRIKRDLAGDGDSPPQSSPLIHKTLTRYEQGPTGKDRRQTDMENGYTKQSWMNLQGYR